MSEMFKGWNGILGQLMRRVYSSRKLCNFICRRYLLTKLKCATITFSSTICACNLIIKAIMDISNHTIKCGRACRALAGAKCVI